MTLDEFARRCIEEFVAAYPDDPAVRRLVEALADLRRVVEDEP